MDIYSNHNGAIHRFPSVACAQKKKKIKQNKVMSIKLESTGGLYSCTLLEVFPAFNHLSLQCLALFGVKKKKTFTHSTSASFKSSFKYLR